jgi:hypothetical protein
MPKDVTIAQTMMRELDAGECWARAEWITDTRRYWISQSEYGYQSNMEIKESYATKWYNPDVYSDRRYVKKLGSALNRIEELRRKDQRKTPVNSL